MTGPLTFYSFAWGEVAIGGAHVMLAPRCPAIRRAQINMPGAGWAKSSSASHAIAAEKK